MSRNHYMSRNYVYDRLYAGGASGLVVNVERNGDAERARFNFSTTSRALSLSLSREETQLLADLWAEVLEDWV